MKSSTRSRIVLAACTLAVATSFAVAQAPKADSIQALEQGFMNPPDAARPMVRWWWFGAAVVKPEILRELQQMKAAGVGGAELAFVYAEVLDDPAKGLKNLPFLSTEMLDDINYAQAEGRKLGLRIDVTLCSGWPYGGPTITQAEAVTRMRTVEVAIAPGDTTVATPKLAEGETLLSAAIVNGTPTLPAVRRGPGGAQQPPPAPTWDPASARIFTPDPTRSPISPSAEGSKRVALFFVQSHTKQEVKRAAVGAEGWVLDPYSHEAVAKHLANVGEPLVKAFGATPPYAIFSDSLEAYGADWTPNLPAEFKKRRGYDLMEHLPELVAGGSPAAENVRHDYGKTLTELVNENYLTQINNWAKAHGTKFRSQTYGEPAVNFSSQNLAGLPEGEGPQWRQFSTLRWASSANHVFGNNVTSGETFTWLHSPVFRAVPLDMKVEADIDFIMGENQLVFHGWPYSAPDHEVPEPGWSLYAAASFNDHNPWFPVESAVNKYITRLSYLMRLGQPANQVAVLLPEDDAWATFSPGHTTMTGVMGRSVTPALMSTILSAGYNVDYIDAEAINSTGLGTHQILVLPPTDRIPVETAKKIATFAAAGGKVIGVGKLPSLTPDGKALTESTAEIALVPDNASLTKALRDASAPDFLVTDRQFSMKEQLGFVRRKLPNADVYFVVNASNQPMATTATFGTTHRNAEILDPDTGTAKSFHVFPNEVSLGLDLAPYASMAVVFFDGKANEQPPAVSTRTALVADLSSDWKVNFTGIGKTVSEATPTDWTADPATKNYSGEAVYSRDFKLDAAPKTAMYLEVEGGQAVSGGPNSPAPPEPRALTPEGLPNPLITRPEPRNFAYYDAPIRAAALVTINGQAAGALWHPPYRLDVSKLLKAGQNHIEIHVYNTALNAWSALPPHDFGPLIAKYGDKFQMQDMNKVMPISSGIFGTVKLVTQGAQ